MPGQPNRDQPTKPTSEPSGPRSMHEDVPVWCDCCSCEPEPRWQQVEDEMERERAEADKQDCD